MEFKIDFGNALPPAPPQHTRRCTHPSMASPSRSAPTSASSGRAAAASRT